MRTVFSDWGISIIRFLLFCRWLVSEAPRWTQEAGGRDQAQPHLVGLPLGFGLLLEALADAGVEPEQVVFVGGYAQEVVAAAHPEFTFVSNDDWPNNNILLSLLYARDHLHQGFLSTYGDIVYSGTIVRKLVDQLSMGPSGVRLQSTVRRSAPISPPPAKTTSVATRLVVGSAE